MDLGQTKPLPLLLPYGGKTQERATRLPASVAPHAFRISGR